MWDEQVEPLASKYRVIRYDARGYGRSAVPVNKDYAHTEDLKALLNHLKVSRAHENVRLSGQRKCHLYCSR